MSKYKKDDFENMMFDVYPYSKKRDILSIFPDLQKHDEFSKEIEEVDKNQLLTYIFLMYDKGSPLVVDITDVETRKDEALSLAGYKQKYGKWNPVIKEFRDLQNEDVNKLITKFFLLQHSKKFETLVSLEEAHSQVCEILRSQLSEGGEDRLKSIKLKVDISSKLGGMSNDIDELRRAIFRKDEEVTEVVEAEVNEQRIFAGIREQRAKLRAQRNGQT